MSHLTYHDLTPARDAEALVADWRQLPPRRPEFHPAKHLTVKPRRQRKLKVAGWKVGSAHEFLDLSEDEARLLRMRLALVSRLREARERSGLSQVELAARMGSSQSRVAKIEAGDSTVSVDLMLRALIAAGASDKEIAKALAGR